MKRDDVELYVTGNFEGDAAALERAIADDPALAAAVADEARFEMLLRDAAAAATFCIACDDIVRTDRCDTCGAAVRPGGYTIERVLVSNAHGRMYVAHDADGKQVALKELAFVQAPSQSTIDAFEREAKFLRALEHPSIPRFVASFEEGRGVHARYYLAQELVDGTSLDRIEQRWYTEDEIVEVARQVLGILVYLQSLSPMIVHRDVKPANLIRRRDGTIALVDFGAAYVDGATAGLTTVGTFGYMPVEQLAGIVDATTDLYALGASLLYLLTRQEPWRLAQTRTTVNVAAPLRAYLDKLTATDPRERFASAKEALAMMDRRAELVKSIATPKRSLAKHAVWIAASVLVVGAGVGVGVAIRAQRLEAQKAHYEAQQAARMATLYFVLPNAKAEAFVDGRSLGSVTSGSKFPIAAGVHRVKVQVGSVSCDQEYRLESGKATTIECGLPALVVSPRLDNTTSVTWSFKSTPFHEAMGTAAKSCGLNIVVPSDLDPKVTAEIAGAPCNRALETVLQAQGLWYELDKDAALVRIGARRAIDEARQEARDRVPRNDPTLPASTQKLDMDFKQAPLRELLTMLSSGVGKLSIVIPDGIDAKTTAYLKNVPWERAFEAVLEAHGLWYRYSPDGKIIRIATRRELDEEEAEGR